MNTFDNGKLSATFHVPRLFYAEQFWLEEKTTQ